MNENNPLYRRKTTTSIYSDDSCSCHSFPWLNDPDNRLKRKKSRLGTHRNQQVHVAPNSVSKTEPVVSKENIYHEPLPKKLRVSPEKKSDSGKPPLKSALRTPLKTTPLPNHSTPIPSCDKHLRNASGSESIRDIPPNVEAAAMGTPVTPKKEVRFAEPPAMVNKFVASRSSPKIPSEIIVKKTLYRVLNLLGTGGSSVVYLVSHSQTNYLLAIKKVKLSQADEEIAKGYINEVQMLEGLQNCDVIIKIYDHELILEDGEKILYVVMEKGDTDLSALIRSVNATKRLSIPMIVYYWSEMLAAVNEVHSRGIIHSDLKPANFLLVRGRLKLIDFGIASSIQGDMTSVYKDVFCGTLNYMSPEAVNCVQCPSGAAGYKITYKADVWSLGCILYNLVYGRLPFQHIKKKWEKLSAIVSPEVNVEFPVKKDIPPVLMDSMKSCLDKNPKNRPSVHELSERTLRMFQYNR